MWRWILIPTLMCGSFSPVAGQEAVGRRPNVVLILADDLGWADLSPYGSTFHETPNLARLASRSVQFTNAYAASPLCSPTRSSILTGLHPARTGITAPVCHLPAVQLEKRLVPAGPDRPVVIADSLTRLKSEYVTLAEVLKDAGYATAHFGKWHLGHGPGYEPRDQGFDLDVPHTPNAAGPGGGYFAPWRFVRDKAFRAERGEHIDEWMAGRAADYIREHAASPFYLNFWMYSVHSPWNSTPERIAHFRDVARPEALQRNPLYGAMVKAMDQAVGRLLDAIEVSGVADRTIVIFTSDNGGWAYPPRLTVPPGYESTPATSNAPLRSGKASNYEGGTRVPMLVRWPGRTRPGISPALFSSVDLFPTILSMTGVLPAKRPSTDGLDQTPAILGERSVRDVVYSHFPHGSEAQERNIPGFWPATWVRKGDWKLIRFYARNDDRTDRLELYDLATDIGEARNRADEEPEVVRELSILMDTFLREAAAVIPKANPAAAGRRTPAQP